MKLYSAEVVVGNYFVNAIGDSPENCIKALVKEYNRQFGSFCDNGFKNKADWLEYHGIDPGSLREIELNKGWTT